MKIYKRNIITKWAKDEGISDEQLLTAAQEVAQGKAEANLGGGLFKKRIARKGQGKRGGYRTIVGYCRPDTNRIIFLYAFAKSDKSNINDKEKQALKVDAKSFFAASDEQVKRLVESGYITEVILDE